MAHTLTYDYSVYCKVNGIIKDSPYTLRNGDIITLIPNYTDFAVNGTVYSSSVANTIAISNSDINITTNSETPTTQGPESTINYTEVSTPRISVDVSTLTGWANLSAGSHDITIVAKADGYKDSAPSAAVQVTKAASMPSKGDIITLDSKQYRVLKTEGTVAEVLAMYDANTSIVFDANRSNTYVSSGLDTYCNTTFYINLSITMQNAIVAKTFQQDSWYYNSGTSGGSGNPIYQGTYQTTNNYRLGLSNAAFGSSISRKCYALSVQDVIDYLGVTTSMGSADTTLTSENVWKMFWNQTTSPGSTYPWLRSADASFPPLAFHVLGNIGNLDSNRVDYSYAVRPAFQIDLSKISWSK